MVDFRVIQGSGRFYFVRHAESTGNIMRIAQGRADMPLTENGRRQAAVAARWFADQQVDLILTSPLSRASQTAQIIAAELGIADAEPWAELNELEIGPFSGINWEQARQRHPLIYRQFMEHSWDGVPGAEPSAEIYERAVALWRRLCRQHQEGKRRILSVTHSGTIQWIIKATVGNHRWMPLFPMPNCAIFCLEVNNHTIPADEAHPADSPAYNVAWTLMGYSPLDGREL